MKYYLLDASKMLSRSDAHDYLQSALELPEYYGRNLDALHDCLKEKAPCRIEILCPEALQNLGDYGELLLEILLSVND